MTCECVKCGFITNSAVSNFWHSDGDKALGCYARVSENNMWEKGCLYDEADDLMRGFVNKILGNMAIKDREVA